MLWLAENQRIYWSGHSSPEPERSSGNEGPMLTNLLVFLEIWTFEVKSTNLKY